MELLRKIYLAVFGIVASMIVFEMANTANFFGVFISRFFPCVQTAGASFPCYGSYDLVIMAVAVVAFVIFNGILILKVAGFYIQKIKNK
jgi:hypothetical protein